MLFELEAKERQRAAGGDHGNQYTGGKVAVCAKMHEPPKPVMRASSQAATTFNVGSRYVDEARKIRTTAPEVASAPKFREWDGGGSLTRYVISLNLKRRHLSPSQLGVVALDIERHIAEEAKAKETLRKSTSAKLQKPDNDQIHAATEAARITGVSERYVFDAKAIQRKAPEVLDKVRTGAINIPNAKTPPSLALTKHPEEIGFHISILRHLKKGGYRFTYCGRVKRHTGRMCAPGVV